MRNRYFISKKGTYIGVLNWQIKIHKAKSLVKPESIDDQDIISLKNSIIGLLSSYNSLCSFENGDYIHIVYSSVTLVAREGVLSVFNTGEELIDFYKGKREKINTEYIEKVKEIVNKFL